MWSVIKSHFHKGKIGFLITGLFIILSVFMMIIGLSICLGMDGLYPNARILSNSPDCYISVFESTDGEILPIFKDILDNRDDVKNYDVQPVYYLTSQEREERENQLRIFFNPDNKNSYTYFNSWNALNIDDESNNYKPRLRNCVEKDGYKIYLTGNFIETSLVDIGNEFTFINNGKIYNGYVA